MIHKNFEAILKTSLPWRKKLRLVGIELDRISKSNQLIRHPCHIVCEERKEIDIVIEDFRLKKPLI